MSLSRFLFGGQRMVSQILANPAPIRSWNHVRTVSTSRTSWDNKVAPKSVQKNDWNRAVSEAEKIVGYPTSFLNLRWLLSDEVANVALHLRKLIGSNHPLLKTAKSLLYNGKNNMQAWGLIVLLLSKAVGHADTVPDMEQDKSAGVLHSQRALAEITEMIRISFLIHQSMVNLQPLIASGSELSADDTFGNKMSLLGGDYLLSIACNELANLRNQDVVEMFSSSVRDISEYDFIGDRDTQNNALPSKPNPDMDRSKRDVVDDFDFNDVQIPLKVSEAMGIPEREWTVRNILGTAGLLGKACQCSLMLAEQPKPLQHQAYLFGKHLALAWQASIDLEPFQITQIPHGATFSLVSAPVLFHLEQYPDLYEEIQKGTDSIQNISFEKIHGDVLKGPGLEKTRELQRKHILLALKVLDELPANDARTALQNIILAMQEL